MAFSTKALLSLVTLLVLATYQAHGLIISNTIVTGLNLNLTLTCQADPAAIGSGVTSPLANAPVTLLNNGQPIGSVTTNPNGSAAININNLLTLARILSLSNLGVRLALPVANCSVLANSTGSLGGTVSQVGNVINGIVNVIVPTLGLIG